LILKGGNEAFEIKESTILYGAYSKAKKIFIGPEVANFLDIKYE